MTPRDTILRQCGVYSRLKNGLQVGVDSLVKMVFLLPERVGKYRTTDPTVPFALTRHDKETFVLSLPAGEEMSHTRAAAFVKRVFRKAYQEHKDTILFDLNSETDEEEEEEERISLHKRGGRSRRRSNRKRG